MSTATDDEDQQEHEPAQLKPRRARRAARFGLGVYESVSSPFSAIGMLGVVVGLFHLGLHGLVAFLVGIWASTVRPAVAAALHVLVTVPFGWLGVHFEVPLVVRDYVSVGLVLAL